MPISYYEIYMYSGELEVQTKRKSVAILQEETNKILNSSGELVVLTDVICSSNREKVSECLGKLNTIEEEIMLLRKQIIREVIMLGNLMNYREDLLRTAYFIDDISGYISGITFRLSNIDSTIIKTHFEYELRDLVDIIINVLFKINEMTRTLTVKPENTMKIANDITIIEQSVDIKYRNIIIKAFTLISSSKDLILFKDTIEGIEGMIDKCQQTSNSFTILALSI